MKDSSMSMKSLPKNKLNDKHLMIIYRFGLMRIQFYYMCVCLYVHAYMYAYTVLCNNNNWWLKTFVQYYIYCI